MMVEVTDEVRRAAAIIYQRFRDYDYAGWILDGTNAMGDADSVIQAFADIYQRGKLEGARLALEAAATVAPNKTPSGECETVGQWTRRTLREAIRALDPAKIVGEG